MQFVQTVAPPQALHARTGLEHGWRAAPFHREGRKTLSSRNLLAAYLVARAACRTDFGHRVRRSSSGSTNIAEEPLFRFGLIADVQYANRDDALNFSGSRLRRYRNSRTLWDRAVKWFRDEKVDFIAQLGDFVDGCNQDLPGGGRKALQELLGPVDQGPPVLHLIGNHELYNFARKEMEDGIPLPGLKVPFRTSAPPALDAEAPSKTSSYYSFSPADGWRVCVLDPYEISIMSHGGGRPGVDEVTLEPGAVSWCQENNPNDITKEDFARGIPPGEARRWVPLNGAVSEQQLIWLEETLELASKKNEETIILSHVVLLPEATLGQNGLTLLWNYDKVLQVLRSAERPPTAVLCGHAHLMVNSRDQVSGTHHVTLPTPVEANPGSDACAVVEAFSNGLLKIRGRGDVLSSTLACSTHATCT